MLSIFNLSNGYWFLVSWSIYIRGGSRISKQPHPINFPSTDPYQVESKISYFNEKTLLELIKYQDCWEMLRKEYLDLLVDVPSVFDDT